MSLTTLQLIEAIHLSWHNTLNETLSSECGCDMGLEKKGTSWGFILSKQYCETHRCFYFILFQNNGSKSYGIEM